VDFVYNILFVILLLKLSTVFTQLLHIYPQL